MQLIRHLKKQLSHLLLPERDLQDYLGRYQDLRDEWKEKSRSADKENINDDIVFETELIRQTEINIDYILLLVAKYHDTHGEDKEILITIQKAIDASPELRSKKNKSSRACRGDL